MDTKYDLKRKYRTINVEPKVPTKQRKKDMELNSMTKKQLIDQIKSLLEELVKLKSKCQSSNDKVIAKHSPIATQTTLLEEELIFPCQLCIYNADNEMDLRIHMDYGHDLDDDVLLSKLKCNICKTMFRRKSNLMSHIKTAHVDTLPNCKYYQTNSCKFNENSCWFAHKKNEPEELKCRYCDQNFLSKSDVMFHQKQNHKDKIPICKKHIKSMCKFKHKCWYTHPIKEQLHDANSMDIEIGMAQNENRDQSQSDNKYINECM